MKPLNVAIAGAGKRVRNHYLPILDLLSRENTIAVAGIFNRTRETADEIAAPRAWPIFDSFDECIKFPSLDAIILAVPLEPRLPMTVKALEAGVHVLSETPLANSILQAVQLADIAKKMAITLKVCEEVAYFPEAELQISVLKSGILGNIKSIINDEAYFGYHGAARLTRLFSSLGIHTTPKKISGWCTPVDRELDLINGLVRFDGNMTYHYRFPRPQRHVMRYGGTWSIVGEQGRLSDNSIVIKHPNGKFERAMVEVVGDQNHIPPECSIERLTLDVCGERYEWVGERAFGPLTRKQAGVLGVLREFVRQVSNCGHQSHGPEEATTDIMIWRGIEYTRRLRLPLTARWVRSIDRLDFLLS